MIIKDKVAIVTGGANGMGYAFVCGLLKKGAQYVAVFDITSNSSCLAEIEKQYGSHKVGLYNCDISNEADFRSNFEKVVLKHRYVDILINNAGVANENHAALLIDVNVKGTILGNLIAIEYMGTHKGGHGGVIVNVASVIGLLNYHALPVYSASKHAIVSFTRSMKENGTRIGVKIFAICPGHTNTKLEYDMKKQNAKHYLDFITEEQKEQFHHFHVQSTENVSDAVMQLITEAECGTAWVVENDEASFKISSTDHFVKKIIHNHEATLFFC